MRNAVKLICHACGGQKMPRCDLGIHHLVQPFPVRVKKGSRLQGFVAPTREALLASPEPLRGRAVRGALPANWRGEAYRMFFCESETACKR